MKHFAQSLLVILFSFPLWLAAQTLPDNYILSAEGTSIKRFQQQSGNGFYGEDTVKTIALTFADPDWWSQIDGGIGYATVTYGDLVLDSVAVKIKGSSSDFANPTLKKSFDLEFDAIHGDQEIEGFTRTNLHSGAFEPAHVREVVFHWIGGHYIPSFKSNLIHVTINGDNWGAYTNTQQLNRDYLREWFVDASGPRWRGESRFGRVGGDTLCPTVLPDDGRQGTFSSLVTLQDTALYRLYYTSKGNHEPEDWYKLTTFIEKLNNFSNEELVDSLGNYLNVDEALWYLAHEILLGDEDGYVFKAQSDYYLYHDDATGRIIPLEYDGNSCMEGKSKEWSPLHRADDACLPLINRLLGIPEWRERYLGHCRYIVEEYMHPDVVLPKIASYIDLIDPFEMNDPIGDSIYTYQEFQSGLFHFNKYVVDRYDFLHNHPLLDVSTSTLSSPLSAMTTGGSFDPTSQDSVTVSVEVSDRAASTVNVYYAPGLGLPFTKLRLFDNGMNGDALANDGRYSGIIPPSPAQTSVVYYFEAQAEGSDPTQNYAATFLPNGAEHEVFTYKVEIDRVLDHPIKINELMASNETTVVDTAGEFDDWIELYNEADFPVDLNGYSLSDKENNLVKWTIDTTLIIPAKGFSIIWCDEDGSQGFNHANFKLSKSGEHVFLTNPAGQLVDDVNYVNQTTDISLARDVDGSGTFIQQAATFGITNMIGVDTMGGGGGIDTTTIAVRERLDVLSSVSIFPNPVSLNANLLGVSGEANTSMVIKLYDAYGRAVHASPVTLDRAGKGYLDMPLQHAGVYIVHITTPDGRQGPTKRLIVQ